MTFNPGSQLDPGQVSDRRGMGRGGVAIGGGGAIGIIVLIAYALLGTVVTNAGTLYRFRQPYVLLQIILAVEGWRQIAARVRRTSI